MAATFEKTDEGLLKVTQPNDDTVELYTCMQLEVLVQRCNSDIANLQSQLQTAQDNLQKYTTFYDKAEELGCIDDSDNRVSIP